MIELVTDTERLDLMGISLREFLDQGQSLNDVWNDISNRLIKEASSVHKDRGTKRLQVRLLLLHPKSSEGYFRQKLEKSPSNSHDQLLGDVKRGIDEIRRVRENIFLAAHPNWPKDKEPSEEDLQKVNEHLNFKFYHHTPFSFLFVTDKQVIVEQYYYKDRKQSIDIPVLRYSRAEVKREFQKSFDSIWEHAEALTELDDSEVGTEVGIRLWGIRNIYGREETTREEVIAPSGIRKTKVVEGCERGDIIRILSNSGNFYVYPRFGFITTLANASERGVSVKFLLLNPVCPQAILRSIAESAPGQIRERLLEWDWESHIETTLYKDTRDSIDQLAKRIAGGVDFQVKLHHTGPACSLFLSPRLAFIDQYSLGRSKRREMKQKFAEDYPTFNFGMARGKTGEMQDDDAPKSGGNSPVLEVLESHFDTIWNSYSINYAVYKGMEKQSGRLKLEFERSLSEIKRWSDDLLSVGSPNG